VCHAFVAFFFRLPGKAYAARRHVWLSGANQVDSSVFLRVILAMVCVSSPLPLFFSLSFYFSVHTGYDKEKQDEKQVIGGEILKKHAYDFP
jgi:hypothetical protein